MPVKSISLTKQAKDIISSLATSLLNNAKEQIESNLSNTVAKLTLENERLRAENESLKQSRIRSKKRNRA